MSGHGTRECYARGCRRAECRAANAAYARRRRKLATWGRTPNGWVDAAPVLEHVQALLAAGYGQNRIADLAGVSQSVIYTLLHGRPGAGKPPTARLSGHTACRILALPLPSVDQLADHTLIDGTGTRRRLQALIAVGWTHLALSRELGWTNGNFSRLLHGYGGKGLVQVRTRRAVVALYDRLWNITPPGGPDPRAIALARRHGWASPLAFDDEEIDDPNARPKGIQKSDDDRALDEIAVERAMRGYPVHLHPAERREVVARLTAMGFSAAQIGERIGKTPRSVQRLRTGARAS